MEDGKGSASQAIQREREKDHLCSISSAHPPLLRACPPSAAHYSPSVPRLGRRHPAPPRGECPSLCSSVLYPLFIPLFSCCLTDYLLALLALKSSRNREQEEDEGVPVKEKEREREREISHDMHRFLTFPSDGASLRLRVREYRQFLERQVFPSAEYFPGMYRGEKTEEGVARARTKVPESGAMGREELREIEREREREREKRWVRAYTGQFPEAQALGAVFKAIAARPHETAPSAARAQPRSPREEQAAPAADSDAEENVVMGEAQSDRPSSGRRKRTRESEDEIRLESTDDRQSAEEKEEEEKEEEKEEDKEDEQEEEDLYLVYSDKDHQGEFHAGYNLLLSLCAEVPPLSSFFPFSFSCSPAPSPSPSSSSPSPSPRSHSSSFPSLSVRSSQARPPGIRSPAPTCAVCTNQCATWNDRSPLSFSPSSYQHSHPPPSLSS